MAAAVIRVRFLIVGFVFLKRETLTRRIERMEDRRPMRLTEHVKAAG